MAWMINQKRKKEICNRVRQIRIERFGDSRGSQKEMARALDIPYTSYRGYEENRINDEFLRIFAKKFNIPYLWLVAAEPEGGPAPEITPSIVTIDPRKGVLNAGKYRIVEVEDDAMHPTIKKGAWVGVVPIDPEEDCQNKLVAVKIPDKKDRIIVRRVVMHGRTVMAIADNPSHEPIVIRRSDIIGEVIWEFSTLK
jgi:SOS-response transcriptional repressor LexA